MGKHGHARTLTAVRISPEGLAAIQALANEVAATRSETIRALLAEALKSPTVIRAAKRRLKERGPDLNAKTER